MGKEENLASYIPMYDPTQSEIIGVIGIHQDLNRHSRDETADYLYLLMNRKCNIIGKFACLH